MTDDRLALVAGALAGRHLAVVRGAAAPPYTDGTTMWVPEGEDDRCVCPVAVQAGLIAIGGLDRRVAGRLLGRRSAASRYAVLEARRLVDELGHVLPARVERDLRALGDFPAPRSAAESLERALAGEPVFEQPWTVGAVRPAVILRARSSAIGAESTANLDAQRMEQLRDMTQQLSEADDDEDTQLRDRVTSVFSKNPLSRLLRELMGAEAASSSQDGGGGGELDVGGRRRVREMGAGGRVLTASAVVAALDDAHASVGTEHPEWDYRAARHKPRHCSVHHLDPGPPDAPRTLRLQPDPQLRRVIARIGLALERHGRLADGEALDLRALVDHAVASAAGAGVEPRVYESRRSTAHDLGVVLLLDASASTSDDRAAGGRIWDEHRVVAAGLIDALEQAGDRVAAYAFRSYGRRDVRALRVKHFDDRFDHHAQRRLIDLEPSGYTRMGAAIRHAGVLARANAGTSRHLVILVSDGRPYEEDYQGRYAEEDTKHALEELTRAGVGCVCLCVGSSQHPDALERIWGSLNHLHVDDTRDITPRTEALIRGSLSAALSASHGEAANHRPTA